MGAFRVVCLEDLHGSRYPGASGPRGKFVQFERDGDEILVFAPSWSCGYHAQIAHRFCRMQEPPWAFEINRKGDDGELDEEGVRIVGGGLWELEERARVLYLGGVSEAFGPFRQDGLTGRIQASPCFDGYTVCCQAAG